MQEVYNASPYSSWWTTNDSWYYTTMNDVKKTKKTILAVQICFSHDASAPCHVYFSVLLFRVGRRIPGVSRLFPGINYTCLSEVISRRRRCCERTARGLSSHPTMVSRWEERLRPTKFKNEDPQFWVTSSPHLLTLSKYEKSLNTKAMITYEKPTTIRQKTTNYKHLAK